MPDLRLPPPEIPEQFTAITNLVANDEIIDVVTSPDVPEVTVIRLGAGSLTPELEQMRLEVLEAGSLLDTAGYVFECPFTRSAFSQFVTYLDSGSWKDEASTAALETSARLDVDVYSGHLNLDPRIGF
jgi:hypothetical protein